MAILNTKLDSLDLVKANGVDKGLFLAGTIVTATAADINRVATTAGKNVNVATATLTLTAATHAGKNLLLNRAAGATLTLPVATGSGVEYDFLVQTTVTTNNYIIKVANAAGILTGYAILGSDTANAALLFGTAVDSDTITMNGTSTGGIAGARVVIRDVATNLYQVELYSNAAGVEATPFSATV